MVKAKLGDLEVIIYGFYLNDAGVLHCKVKVPCFENKIDVLAEMIEVV